MTTTSLAAPPATVPVLHCGDRTLAVALGVARATPAGVRVPSVVQRPVAGRSPLEASGWAGDAPAGGRAAVASAR